MAAMHTYTSSSETHLWHRHLQSHPPFSPREKQETNTKTHTQTNNTQEKEYIKCLDQRAAFHRPLQWQDAFKHDVVQ